MEERWQQAEDLDQQLQQLAVQRGEDALLPELYRVPAEAVEAERQSPGSQRREASDNVPLLWVRASGCWVSCC